MSCCGFCVASGVGHRRVDDHVCANGGGVGEVPAMVLQRS
jgi:hypothetical protein